MPAGIPITINPHDTNIESVELLAYSADIAYEVALKEEVETHYHPTKHIYLSGAATEEVGIDDTMQLILPMLDQRVTVTCPPLAKSLKDRNYVVTGIRSHSGIPYASRNSEDKEEAQIKHAWDFTLEEITC